MANTKPLVRPAGPARDISEAGDTLICGSIDRSAAAALTIGTTNANAITIGSVGMTTTIAGNLDVSGTATVVNTTTLEGDVDIGDGGNTITIGGDGGAGAGDTIYLGTESTGIGTDSDITVRTLMTIDGNTASGSIYGDDARIDFSDAGNALIIPNVASGSAVAAAGSIIEDGTDLKWYDGAAWQTVVSTTSGTLQVAYVAGNTIAATAAEGALAFSVADTQNIAVLTLTQSDVTNNPDALIVSNAGSGAAISMQGAGSRTIVSDSANLDIMVTTSGDLSLTSDDDIDVTAADNISVKADDSIILIYDFDDDDTGEFKVSLQANTLIECDAAGAVDITPVADQDFTVTCADDGDVYITTGATGVVEVDCGNAMTLMSEIDLTLVYDDGDAAGSFIVQRDSGGSTIIQATHAGAVTVTPETDQDFTITTDGVGDIIGNSDDYITWTYDINEGGGAFQIYLYNDEGADYLMFECQSDGDVEITPVSNNDCNITTTGETGEINLDSEYDINIIYDNADTSGTFAITRDTTDLIVCDHAGNITLTSETGHDVSITSSGGGDIELSAGDDLAGLANDDVRFIYDDANTAGDFYIQRDDGGSILFKCDHAGVVTVTPESGQNFDVTTAGGGDIVLNAAAGAGVLDFDAGTGGVFIDTTGNMSVSPNGYVLDSDGGIFATADSDVLLVYDDDDDSGSFYIRRDTGGTDLITCTHAGAVTIIAETNADFTVTTAGTGDISLSAGDDIVGSANDKVWFVYDDSDSIGSFKIIRDTGGSVLVECPHTGAVTITPEENRDCTITCTGTGEINLTTADELDIACDSLTMNGSTGWSGTFTNGDGDTVTVLNGIVTNVA